MKQHDDRELEMACYGEDSFKPFVECSDTVREPARPFIDKAIKDAEWDERYEIFERHYPLIKWVVVAGLLGLVWLVSL